MTRKKTHTKDTALLDALRSNLNLLGELAVRYAVEFHPEPPTEGPTHYLLPRRRARAAGAGYGLALPGATQSAAPERQEPSHRPAGHLPGQRLIGHRPERRGLPPGGHRGRPRRHRQPQPPVRRPGPSNLIRPYEDVGVLPIMNFLSQDIATTAQSALGCAERNRQRDGVQVASGTMVGTGKNVSAILLDSSLSSIEEPASTTATFSLRRLVETTNVADAPALRPSTVSVTASFS